MGKAPATQFYFGDWRRDTQVQMAGMETRGVWFEMLCCMWDSPTRGLIEGDLNSLARLLGCDLEILFRSLNEIIKLKIGEVSNDNGENVTKALHVMEGNFFVTIKNRRMYREEKNRENNRLRVQKYRAKRKGNGDVMVPSSSSSSSSISSSSISKKASPVINELLGKNFQNNISDFALPLIKEKIIDIAEILKVEKIFENVDKFILDLYDENLNPRTILHALIRCYLKRPDSPKAYCRKIISIEDGNYNERDHQKSKS
jgi:hypothetical protein